MAAAARVSMKKKRKEKKKRHFRAQPSCTHQEEDAEVGQISKEVLHADRVRVKGKEIAEALVELLHVLVHHGQLFILLPGMLAEAVRRTESRKKEVVHTGSTSHGHKEHNFPKED